MPQTRNTTRPATPIPPEQALVAITQAWDKDSAAISNLLTRDGDVARYRELFLDVVTKDEKLMRCTPESLIRSVRDMAKLGLEPVLGEAYLVPFWNDRKGSYEATLIIGYEGLKNLAFRSGFVTLIEGDVVRELDEFTYVRGFPETILRHIPGEGDRGEIRGAWSMVHMRDAPRPLIAYLPVDRIEQRRRVSKSGTNRDTGEAIGIWRDWPEEQAAKTALRFNLKLAPKSIRQRVADALAIEDAVDSLLQVEAGSPDNPQLTGGKRMPRRRRIMARLVGGPVDEPEGDQATGEPVGTTESDDQPSDGQSGTPTGEGEPAPAPVVVAQESEGTATGRCGAPNPYPDGTPCGMPAGHETASNGPKVHRELDETGKVVATWPVT